jgi:hypothetical protein
VVGAVERQRSVPERGRDRPVPVVGDPQLDAQPTADRRPDDAAPVERGGQSVRPYGVARSLLTAVRTSRPTARPTRVIAQRRASVIRVRPYEGSPRRCTARALVRRSHDQSDSARRIQSRRGRLSARDGSACSA